MRSLGVQTGRRCFATGNRLQVSYGFIGLGRMGEYFLAVGGLKGSVVADKMS